MHPRRACAPEACTRLSGAIQVLERKRSVEAEKYRGKIVDALRAAMVEEGLTTEGLFGKMCGEGAGPLPKQDFVNFVVETLKVACTSEQAERFFDHIGTAEGTLEADAFECLLKVFKVVCEPTTMMTGFNIKGSEVVRRIKKGDIFEILEGPRKEETAGILRVKGKAVKDGVSGWITVAGNQGTVYLKDGGNLFKVLVPHTKLFHSKPEKDAAGKIVEGTDEDSSRNLLKSELLDVLEWETTDVKDAPCLRIRVRAKLDGKIGWTDTSKVEPVIA